MTVIAANCMVLYLMICTSRLIPLCESLSLATGFFALFTNMDFYCTQPLTFVQNRKSYPVGKLADLEIHFMHYHSEQEANENGNFARHE